MPDVVLITGAARRIGRAIATAFAHAGFRVVIHCNRSLSDAQCLLAELGGESAGHCVVQADFRVSGEVSALIPSLVRRGIVPVCLVNSAAIYSRIPLRDATPETLAEVFTINFAAPFELMRSFANVCGTGSIINITDARTAFPDPHSGPYALAKKALAEATAAAALDWAPQIRVNAIAPGIVLPPPGGAWTRMQNIIPAIPMQQRTTEQELADTCLFLQRSSSITGQSIFLDGGIHLLGHSIETPPPKKGDP